MKDNLHNIEAAVKTGAEKTEKDFTNFIAVGSNGKITDKSGSCALLLLVVEQDVYVVNTGDSRALTSISQMDGISYVSHTR